MERKELMIGNYVIYDGQVYRVTMIGQTSVMIENDTYATEAVYEDLVPILVTPEILLSNGFTDVESNLDFGMYHYYPGEGNVIEDYDLHIGYYDGKYSVRYRDDSKYGILFVHELQNVFNVFGVKREII